MLFEKIGFRFCLYSSFGADFHLKNNVSIILYSDDPDKTGKHFKLVSKYRYIQIHMEVLTLTLSDIRLELKQASFITECINILTLLSFEACPSLSRAKGTKLRKENYSDLHRASRNYP